MCTQRPELSRQPPGSLWVELSTAKLAEQADPFSVLGLKNRTLSYYTRGTLLEAVYRPPGSRPPGYNRRRIGWLLRHGWTDAPELDWVWSGLTYDRPVLLDGHHRFCAAILAGDTRFLVDYSGPLDAIPNLSEV